MKNIVSLLLLVAALFAAGCTSTKQSAGMQGGESKSVTIYASSQSDFDHQLREWNRQGWSLVNSTITNREGTGFTAKLTLKRTKE